MFDHWKSIFTSTQVDLRIRINLGKVSGLQIPNVTKNP